MTIRRPDGLVHDEITRDILGSFFEVYGELGYGFLERAYLNALTGELTDRGHRVAREVAVQIRYKSREIGWHRLDMLVDGKVIVECKSTDLLHPGANRQITNYLKATELSVALLLHFGLKPKFYRFYRRT